MMRRFVLIVIVGLSLIFALSLRAAEIDISLLLAAQSPTELVKNVYTFALGISGLLAFGTIVYGAIVYTLAAGNPSGQNEGKEWIKQAIFGLLLLAGSYIILNTINPALVDLKLKDITVLDPERQGLNLAEDICNSSALLAEKYNTYYPARNAPDLVQLMTCIESKISPWLLGSTFTVDISHPSCNYTRGATICENSCSHVLNSCHYGGQSGSKGALAVDYGSENIGGDLIDAAKACGAKAARCENSAGQDVGRSGSACKAGANHVHISAGSCDAN